MPDGPQRRDRRFHYLAARPPVEGRDDTYPAGIMLLARIVEPALRQMFGVAEI